MEFGQQCPQASHCDDYPLDEKQNDKIKRERESGKNAKAIEQQSIFD